MRRSTDVNRAHLAHLAAVHHDDRSRLLADVDENLSVIDLADIGTTRRVHHRRGFEFSLERLEASITASVEHLSEPLLGNPGDEQLARVLGRVHHMEVDDHIIDVPLRELALDLELDDLLDLAAIVERQLQRSECRHARVDRDPDVVGRDVVILDRLAQDTAR